MRLVNKKPRKGPPSEGGFKLFFDSYEGLSEASSGGSGGAGPPQEEGPDERLVRSM
jgi:hypothetical protein